MFALITRRPTLVVFAALGLLLIFLGFVNGLDSNNGPGSQQVRDINQAAQAAQHCYYYHGGCDIQALHTQVDNAFNWLAQNEINDGPLEDLNVCGLHGYIAVHEMNARGGNVLDYCATSD